jgi:hypothetical protein
VLKRIFIPKRKVVTGGLRKFRNEELDNLYFSSHFIKSDEIGEN